MELTQVQRLYLVIHYPKIFTEPYNIMATGTIKNQLLKKAFTFSNVTINAKDVYRHLGITIPSGYIPIGVYLETSGAETTISALPPHRRSTETTAIIELYNSYTSALTVSGTINVIYMQV